MGWTNLAEGRRQAQRRDAAPEVEGDEQHQSPLPAGPWDLRQACADAGHDHGDPARDHCEPPLAGCGIVQHPGPASFFPPHRTTYSTIYWIDRTSVVQGKRVAGSVTLGGRRGIEINKPQT